METTKGFNFVDIMTGYLPIKKSDGNFFSMQNKSFETTLVIDVV